MDKFMLDLSKKYTDKYGRNIELFSFKDGRYWGRVFGNVRWIAKSWPKHYHGLSVKPEKIKRTYWLVHYSSGEAAAFTSEKEANMLKQHPQTLAITGPHTVEFEVEDK